MEKSSPLKLEDNRYLKPDEIPKQFDVPVVLTYDIEAGYLMGYCMFGFEPTDAIVLGNGRVIIDVPSQDLTTKAVNLLEEAIKKEQADSYMKVKKLEDKIQQLKQIEYKPSFDATSKANKANKLIKKS